LPFFGLSPLFYHPPVLLLCVAAYLFFEPRDLPLVLPAQGRPLPFCSLDPNPYCPLPTLFRSTMPFLLCPPSYRPPLALPPVLSPPPKARWPLAAISRSRLGFPVHPDGLGSWAPTFRPAGPPRLLRPVSFLWPEAVIFGHQFSPRSPSPRVQRACFCAVFFFSQTQTPCPIALLSACLFFFNLPAPSVRMYFPRTLSARQGLSMV